MSGFGLADPKREGATYFWIDGVRYDVTENIPALYYFEMYRKERSKSLWTIIKERL